MQSSLILAALGDTCKGLEPHKSDIYQQTSLHSEI